MCKVKGTSLAKAMDAHEPESPYWTVTDHGYLQPGGGFVAHQCDVDVVAQFRSTWLGKVNLVNELNTAAYMQPCPKCAAEPGEECFNLIERGKGRDVHTKNPHQERYPEGAGT